MLYTSCVVCHCQTGGVPVRRPVEHGGGGEGLDQQALFIITTSITTSITIIISSITIIITTSITNITTTITTSITTSITIIIISILFLTNRGLSVEKARKLVNNERRMRWREERGYNMKMSLLSQGGDPVPS